MEDGHNGSYRSYSLLDRSRDGPLGLAAKNRPHGFIAKFGMYEGGPVPGF